MVANSKHLAELSGVLAAKKLAKTSQAKGTFKTETTQSHPLQDNYNPMEITKDTSSTSQTTPTDADKAITGIPSDSLAPIQEADESQTDTTPFNDQSSSTDITPQQTSDEPFSPHDTISPSTDTIQLDTEVVESTSDTSPPDTPSLESNQHQSNEIAPGITDSTLIVNPSNSQLPSKQNQEYQPEEEANDVSHKRHIRGYSDLAASLHLELAASVTSEVDEGLSKLTEKLDSSFTLESLLDSDNGPVPDFSELHKNADKYEPFQGADSPIIVSPSLPSTPKPAARGLPTFDGSRGTRPLLPSLSSTASPTPFSLSPLSPPGDAEHVAPYRRAPPLSLDISGGFSPRKDNSPTLTPPSRYNSLFESPKGRAYNSSNERFFNFWD